MADGLSRQEQVAADGPRPAETAAVTVSALAAKADDLEALRSALIDAAGVSFGLWVSYLFVLFYLLVAAGGVTHRDLFFESPVKLPFLNVDLPLKGFFWLGPALFLIVHAYLLLHFVMLAGKIRVFDTQLREQIDDPEVRTKLRRQLPSNIFVQFLAGPREFRDGIIGLLLWLIALISLVVGPIALLVFFQLQFLSYHDEWITWWQRIAVLVDLALLWTLWPRVVLPQTVSTEKSQARRLGCVESMQRAGTIAGMLLITVFSLLLVFAIATFPGEWLEEKLRSLQPIAPLRKALVAGDVDEDARKPLSLWSDRLVLPGLDVIDHAKFGSEPNIEAVPQTTSLRARHLEGAVLIGASLPKVDFTAARLERARLDGADLRAASFNHAHLQGASLHEQTQALTFRSARLQGADLENAQLQGADLEKAELRAVSLEHAHLQGASLNLAQLQGASLHGAQLQGASLSGAELQGAWLSGAQFQWALLDSAQLQGAWLEDAQFQGALLTFVKVWRADARHVNTTDALIANATPGPEFVVLAPGVWNPHGSFNSFEIVKENLQREVPDGGLRRFALEKIARLDPRKHLGEEEEIARHWHELEMRSPTPELYDAKLAQQWRQIGCSTDGAPYVLSGMIRRLNLSLPISQLPQFVDGILENACAGARELSEDDKAKARALRDWAENQNAQPMGPPTTSSAAAPAARGNGRSRSAISNDPASREIQK